jgi:hypothetical protein
MIKCKSIGLWIKLYLFEWNNLDWCGNFFDSDIRPTNVALNVQCHNEDVATDTIESNVSAIDGGQKYA